MSLLKLTATATLMAAWVLLSAGVARCQEGSSGSRDPAAGAQRDPGGLPADRPEGKRGPRHPGDTHPSGPARDGDGDRSAHRWPPREEDRDEAGPADRRPPREGDGEQSARRRPPREEDRDGAGPADRRPPRGEEAGRPHPPGAPRWPHEDWESLRNNDPEMFALLRQDSEAERQEHELAIQYRQAPKDQQAKIKQQVEELVNKHFDLRQQRRALELKRLEGELQRLRESAERRTKARAEIVAKRVAELLGRDDDLSF